MENTIIGRGWKVEELWQKMGKHKKYDKRWKMWQKKEKLRTGRGWEIRELWQGDTNLEWNDCGAAEPKGSFYKKWKGCSHSLNNIIKCMYKNEV